jgi:SAM-dependent methyltransferase
MLSQNSLHPNANNIDTLGLPTYWERAAQSACGTYISDIEEDAILRAHAFAGTPTRALEIGCEGGRWSKLLSDLSWKMTCTDVDAQSVKLCQQRLPTASCILVSPESEQIPCETNSMGLLLCIEVPRVIKSRWFPQESRRVLTDGGLIVGVFFNLISWRGLLAHLATAVRKSYDFYDLAYPSWRKEFCKHGFRFVYEKGLCWFPFRRASNSSLIPTFVGIERRLGLQALPDLSPWVVFVAEKRHNG